MASASRKQNMKAKDVLIGVAGPIVISDFMDYLDRAGDCQSLPVGLGGYACQYSLAGAAKARI